MSYTNSSKVSSEKFSLTVEHHPKISQIQGAKRIPRDLSKAVVFLGVDGALAFLGKKDMDEMLGLSCILVLSLTRWDIMQ